MSLLVLTAMEVEKKTLLATMKDIKTIELLNHSLLYKGTLDGKPFSLVESGIGKVNAAMTCALAIQEHGHENLSLIINSGVAGAMLPEQKPCDIVIADSVSYYDVDVRAFGHALGQIPGQPAVYPTQTVAMKKCFQICQDAGYQVRVGQIISGDCFIEDAKRVKELRNAFPTALAVEMEGAAVGHVSYRCGVPFLVIRAISDASDSDAKDSYQQFLEKAAQHSERIVRDFINAEKNT